MIPDIPSSPAFTRRNAIFAATLLGLGASLAKFPKGAIAHQDEHDPLAGTTIEQLGGGMPSAVPGSALVLLRVTMEPATEIPPHSHPGPVALYVESGTFGTAFVEGTGSIMRAPKGGTPQPAIDVAAGDDAQMTEGDNLFYEGAVHTMRNDGEDTLVLLVSALFDAEAPGFEWADEATPAAIRNRMPL